MSLDVSLNTFQCFVQQPSKSGSGWATVLSVGRIIWRGQSGTTPCRVASFTRLVVCSSPRRGPDLWEELKIRFYSDQTGWGRLGSSGFVCLRGSFLMGTVTTSSGVERVSGISTILKRRVCERTNTIKERTVKRTLIGTWEVYIK